MSYLDGAITEITTDVERGACYVIEETENVELTTSLDASKYCERKYRRDNNYDGYSQVVAEEVDDGYKVMIMEPSV